MRVGSPDADDVRLRWRVRTDRHSEGLTVSDYSHGMELLSAPTGEVHEARSKTTTRCGQRLQSAERIATDSGEAVTCQFCVAARQSNVVLRPAPRTAVGRLFRGIRNLNDRWAWQENRGAVLLLVIVLTLASVALWLRDEWSGTDRDCSDFSTQAEAQSYYLGQSGDPDNWTQTMMALRASACRRPSSFLLVAGSAP